MTQPISSSEAIDQAFVALAVYKDGAARAPLLPIDRAVVSGVPGNLESRLLQVLEQQPAEPAREYVFSKLSIIGTTKSVRALAEAALQTTPSATAARTALEAMPGSEATRALIDGLSRATAGVKAALLNSLGVRRDPSADRAILAVLKADETSFEVIEAAVAALGRIGTARSAKALRDFQPRSPQQVRPALSNAMLVCADQLLSRGERNQARELYAVLAVSTEPRHVRDASARGLLACS